MDKPVCTITINLTNDHAKFFLQFLRRTHWADFCDKATDELEALHMEEAAQLISNALTEAGASWPRP